MKSSVIVWDLETVPQGLAALTLARASALALAGTA
jgi:hypothetical protein